MADLRRRHTGDRVGPRVKCRILQLIEEAEAYSVDGLPDPSALPALAAGASRTAATAADPSESASTTATAPTESLRAPATTTAAWAAATGTAPPSRPAPARR